MRLVIAALSLGAAVLAQVKPTNPGFEVGETGEVPPGWFVPQVVSQAGFGAKLVDQGCRTGARCAMLTGVVNHPPNIFGNIIQTVPAAGYTLRHVRLRSAIRVEGEQTRAQMWLRLDRADNSMAFLENMNARPITSSTWNTYDIETEVPEDVSRIVFGVMLFGGGNAWVDDVSLDILDEIKKDIVEPARPLTARGLTNLTAFARLYGYVRFFHPSDEAARTDWESFAIDGVRSAEQSASEAELAARLQKLFQPIAPTVQVFPSGERPEPAALVKGPQIIRYKHHGVGMLPSTTPYQTYRSEREKKAAGGEQVPPPFEAELAPGVTARVPLALYADSNGTLPHAPRQQPPPLYHRSAEDRGTRLGAVVIAWNVLQHFYPCFDVVKTDWDTELPKALRAAAVDRGVEEFHKTLERLIAALKDGHGRVGSPRSGPVLQAPLTLEWIEDQLTVTRVQKDASEGIAPGDRVLSIDGKPVEKAAAEARALISGATEQWVRYRMASELRLCNPDTKRITLEVERFARPGTSTAVNLACVPPKPKHMETYSEPRPDKIAELEPGIFYVDLARVNEADWKAVVPRLENAKGIIFDMRGYPGRPAILALGHLTETTIRCARWNVPVVTMPDRLDFRFNESGWDVKPEQPYFTARRVFMTDGRAISYAETVPGIVEHYKLGEIVGGPTAGTNGNVNPFKLPGGFTVSWTGMKVLKHDGSQHHGIGILPTVPASRTRTGVAEGRDEVLGRALEVVKSGQAVK